MNRARLILLLLTLIILLSGLACGRKSPPLLPKEETAAGVVYLKGDVRKGQIFLEGRIKVTEIFSKIMPHGNKRNS